jgi:hypothetical protein
MSITKIQILTNAYHDYSSIHGNIRQLRVRKINQKDYNKIPEIFNEIQNGFHLKPVKIKSLRLVKYFKHLGFNVKPRLFGFTVSL